MYINNYYHIGFEKTIGVQLNYYWSTDAIKKESCLHFWSKFLCPNEMVITNNKGFLLSMDIVRCKETTGTGNIFKEKLC